ncbi:MAG: iron-sulfur cluster assembly scaffold protein [Pseudomonadota bacterium]|nr:iron-sulfur cluster assembly scaffold protein [Pseudomonadota bacterium]
MTTYNAATLRHFGSATAAGVLRGANVRRGMAGTCSAGTWVQFDVEFDSAEHPTCIEAVRFLAFGCPHVIAVADFIAGSSVGYGVRPALPERLASLQARFDVPTDKMGRLLIIEDAWIAALASPL